MLEGKRDIMNWIEILRILQYAKLKLEKKEKKHESSLFDGWWSFASGFFNLFGMFAESDILLRPGKRGSNTKALSSALNLALLLQ